MNRKTGITGDGNLVVNATNIGSKPSGIAIYGINLLRQLARQERRQSIIIYLNRNCHRSIKEIAFPANITLQWVSGRVAPECGFIGHLLRLLLANIIALRHRSDVLFNTSQLEACWFHPNQIIMIHDLIPLLFRDLHRKQFYYFRYILPRVLRSAKQIITPSHHTRHLLINKYRLSAERITVIPNGISPAGKSIRKPEPAKAPYILFTGRLCRMKNIPALLRAFDMLKDDIPHRLMLVGNSEGWKISDETSLSEALKQRIDIRGYLAEAELQALYKAADVFVFPSFYEGFGLPPLEAMSAGCPVIVSQSASLPEVCGNAALYVNPHSAESIASGIRLVLSNPGLRRTMVERGLQRSRHFRWATAVAHHLQVINRYLPLPGTGFPESSAQPDISRSSHPCGIAGTGRITPSASPDPANQPLMFAPPFVESPACRQS